MAEYIDNKTRLLGDDLKTELGNSSQVEIIASIFTIYAFESLKVCKRQLGPKSQE